MVWVQSACGWFWIWFWCLVWCAGKTFEEMKPFDVLPGSGPHWWPQLFEHANTLTRAAHLNLTLTLRGVFGLCGSAVVFTAEASSVTDVWSDS